jgi:drug/metabolite transporter (DMT)-like permease
MEWMFLALIGSAFLAAVNTIDKTILHGYIRNASAFTLLIGIAQITVGVVVTLATVRHVEYSLAATGWALLFGALWGMAAVFLLRTLHKQEVTRVIPVFQIYPVFAALMAFVFLGETLTSLQWASVFIVVTGGALLSVRRDTVNRHLFLHRSFFALVLASMIAGGGHVTGKLALEGLPILAVHGVRNLALGCVLVVASMRPEAFAEVKDLVRAGSRGLKIMAVNELVVVNVALLLILWALSLGPVALVTTITASSSFFVFLYSTLLTLKFRNLLGERVSMGTMTVKFISIGLIVGGLSMMTLG